MLPSDRSVYLSCCQFRVPEEILDTAQVGTALQEVSGIRMAQRMGERPEPVTDHAADASRVETATADATSSTGGSQVRTGLACAAAASARRG